MKRLFSRFPIEYIASPDIWGPMFYGFIGVMSALLSVATDIIRLNNDSIYWVLIFALTFCVFLCMGWLYKAFYFRKIRTKTQALVGNLIAAAILGIVHNDLVAILAHGLDLDPHIAWIRRSIGGLIFGVGLLVLFGVAFNSQLRRQQLMQDIVYRHAELKQYLQNSNQIVMDESQEQSNRLRDLLLPKLDYIQNLLQDKTAHQDTIKLLRYLIQADVRPLSRDLAFQKSALLAQKVESNVKENLVIGAKYHLNKLIFPMTFFILVSFTIGLMDDGSVEISEQIGLIVTSLSSILLWCITFLTRKVPPMSANTALVWLSGLFLLNSAFGIALIVALGEKHLWALIIYFEVGGLVSFFISAVWSLLNQHRKLLYKELLNTNYQLTQAVTRLRQRLWLSRRQLVSQLHGTVQGAITAAVTRLSGPEGQTEEAISLATSDLDRAVAALQNRALSQVDLVAALKDLKAAWDGVCTFDWELSPENLAAITGNPDNAFFVVAIATEAISNAVRHGGATDVALKFLINESDSLGIEICNNGSRPEQDPKMGTGSALISELTSSWKFAERDGRTVLKLELPLSDHQELLDYGMPVLDEAGGGAL